MMILKNSLPRKAIIFDLRELLWPNIVCLQLSHKNEDLSSTYCKRSPFTLFVHKGHLDKEQNHLASGHEGFNALGQSLYTATQRASSLSLLGRPWVVVHGCSPASFHQQQIILPAGVERSLKLINNISFTSGVPPSLLPAQFTIQRWL